MLSHILAEVIFKIRLQMHFTPVTGTRSTPNPLKCFALVFFCAIFRFDTTSMVSKNRGSLGE